ncbi:MAG TPA: O-antigen ligase family protein [Coriobacteriia bacterium]
MASGTSSKGKSNKASKGAAAVQAKRAQAASAPKPQLAVTAGMTTTEIIAWYSLQALVLLVPIAMSNMNWLGSIFPGSFQLPLTYDQFDIVKVFVMRFFAISGLLAWSFQFFFRGGKLRRTKLDWAIVAFLAWVLLTSFTSISIATALLGKYRRFEGFFSFLTYAAVYFLTVQLADRPSRIRSLARTLMISGMVVAGYGVLQYLGLDPINWGSKLPFEANRAFSTFGNPDLLGGFLIFPLAISVALALSEKNIGWRIFYWATFLVTTVSWFVAFVRGAWIGGAVALIIVAVAAWLSKTKLGAVDWSAGGLVLAGATAIVVRSASNPNATLNVWERLQSIFKFGEGSALTRFEIWEAAWNAVKARPIFGFGADTFRLVFPKYKPLAYVKDAGYLSVADNVHDYPLQLMAGIGIIGFLLLYGIFGWALWLGFPNAFARGKGTERLVVAGFWAAAVGYITHLMTGLSVTGSTVFLWLALAIVVAPTAWVIEFKRPSWGPVVGAVLCAVLAAAWVGNVTFVVADNYFLRGQFPQTGENASALLKTAIALDPFNDMYRSMLGQSYQNQALAWLNQAQSEQTAGTDPSASRQQAQLSLNEAIASYKDTISIVPTEYDNYLFLSGLYNQAGAYIDLSYFKQAVEWADRGIAVEPFGPGIRMQKALAQASQGDTVAAAKTLDAAVDMDPNYAEIHALYAQVLAQAGRTQDAIAQYKALLAIDASNATYAAALKSLEGTAGAGATTTP